MPPVRLQNDCMVMPRPTCPAAPPPLLLRLPGVPLPGAGDKPLDEVAARRSSWNAAITCSDGLNSGVPNQSVPLCICTRERDVRGSFTGARHHQVQASKGMSPHHQAGMATQPLLSSKLRPLPSPAAHQLQRFTPSLVLSIQPTGEAHPGRLPNAQPHAYFSTSSPTHGHDLTHISKPQFPRTHLGDALDAMQCGRLVRCCGAGSCGAHTTSCC